jgi:hypothetical protein
MDCKKALVYCLRIEMEKQLIKASGLVLPQLGMCVLAAQNFHHCVFIKNDHESIAKADSRNKINFRK